MPLLPVCWSRVDGHGRARCVSYVSYKALLTTSSLSDLVKKPTMKRQVFSIFLYNCLISIVLESLCENTLAFAYFSLRNFCHIFVEEWYAKCVLRQIRQVVNTLEESAWLVLLISTGERTDASSARRVSIPPSLHSPLPFARSSITFYHESSRHLDKYTTGKLSLLLFLFRALYIRYKCGFAYIFLYDHLCLVRIYVCTKCLAHILGTDSPINL